MKHVWSFYSSVLIVLALARMVQKIVTETGGFGSRYGPLILAGVLALGIVGYVFQTPFAHRWVWMAIFWLLAIVSAGLLILAASLVLDGLARTAGLIVGILLVLAPGQWQLFRYAHRSSSLWGAGSDPSS